MKSPREIDIENNLVKTVEGFNLSGKAVEALKLLINDDEIHAVQEYANTVSIIRLGFNDHGPVHMRIVAKNAILMLDLLKKAGIQTSLEKDECGDYEDSLTGVIFGAMLHDVGMTMGRQNHEFHSAIIAHPLIDRILSQVYSDIRKRVMIRDLALEGVVGHMGTIKISSLEAGIIGVADGCDMTKGRARIPIALLNIPRVGHIHQYSANSIEKVIISAGEEKPIRIEVNMSSEVGIFQVEEVLMHKISGSTLKPYIELFAQVQDRDTKRYL
jgi:metal-dependent HD superfamily phosphatase/phosphodiesterase